MTTKNPPVNVNIKPNNKQKIWSAIKTIMKKIKALVFKSASLVLKPVVKLSRFFYVKKEKRMSFNCDTKMPVIVNLKHKERIISFKERMLNFKKKIVVNNDNNDATKVSNINASEKVVGAENEKNSVVVNNDNNDATKVSNINASEKVVGAENEKNSVVVNNDKEDFSDAAVLTINMMEPFFQNHKKTT